MLLRRAATKTGLSHATIQHIINGGSVSSESIRRLAQAFGGDGNERLALEDAMLIIAGHRTRRPEGQELSQPLARLIDMVSRFNESQLKLMAHFVEFLAKMEKE